MKLIITHMGYALSKCPSVANHAERLVKKFDEYSVLEIIKENNSSTILDDYNFIVYSKSGSLQDGHDCVEYPDDWERVKNFLSDSWSFTLIGGAFEACLFTTAKSLADLRPFSKIVFHMPAIYEASVSKLFDETVDLAFNNFKTPLEGIIHSLELKGCEVEIIKR